MDKFNKDFLLKRQKIKNIKREIPKDYSIEFKKLEILYEIYTRSTCFVFGDEGVLNKYMETDVPEHDYVDYFSEDIELFKQFLEHPENPKFKGVFISKKSSSISSSNTCKIRESLLLIWFIIMYSQVPPSDWAQLALIRIN